MSDKKKRSFLLFRLSVIGSAFVVASVGFLVFDTLRVPVWSVTGIATISALSIALTVYWSWYLRR